MVGILGALLAGVGCFFCSFSTCMCAKNRGCCTNYREPGLEDLYRLRQQYIQQISAVDARIAQYERQSYEYYTWTRRLRILFGRQPDIPYVYTQAAGPFLVAI